MFPRVHVDLSFFCETPASASNRCNTAPCNWRAARRPTFRNYPARIRRDKVKPPLRRRDHILQIARAPRAFTLHDQAFKLLNMDPAGQLGI